MVTKKKLATKKVARKLDNMIQLGEASIDVEQIEGVMLLPRNGDGLSGCRVNAKSGAHYEGYFPTDDKVTSDMDDDDEEECYLQSQEKAIAFKEMVEDRLEGMYE